MSHYLFTITVPMYNAAPYLRATLRSLAWQRYPAAGVQIILVDDGSDDDSAAIADAWAAGRANVTVIQAPHRGVGAARNEALAIAEGEWFASVDADDILDRDYLAEVDHLLARDARGVTSAVCTRLWVLNEETGRWTDTHALGGKFHHGDRLVALQDEPEAFVLSSTTFLRTSVLRAGHLTFDPAVRPTFEDGHLIGRYLACFDDPVLAIATKARYYYRRRTIAKDSLTQTTWSRDGNYTSAPESGYLGMLRAVTERRGETPVWAQYMVLYNIMWYLVEEQSMESKTAWVEGDLARRFLATLGEIMSYIDRTTIEQFPYPRLTWIMRQAILVRFKDQVSAPRVFQLARTGETARAFLLCHGPVPPLVARTDAGAREVVVTGTRSHLYFGEEWMCELALAWPCPGTDDTVLMGGRPARYLDIRRWHPRAGAPSRHKLAPDLRAKRSRIALVLHRLWRRLEVGHVATGRSYGTLLVRMVCGGVGTVVRRWHEAARERWAAKAKARATTPAVQARYGGAWLVMDRPKLADDNGEHLYRYLLRTRPDLNAFFLLDRSSPHWSRLEAEGFRLLAYGSDAAVLATLNAVVRISSDAVGECMYPISRRYFAPLPGKFVFLQHGVQVSDLSRWLNGKDIALFVVSTLPEFQAMVGPGSNYVVREDQVALLGLARWDDLVRRRAHQERDTILVAPTWRVTLAQALETGRTESARRQIFLGSTYGQAWLGLLDALTRVAAGHEIRLVFHHRLNSLIPSLDLPAGVTRVVPARVDYQTEIVRAAAMVTDYSSLSFDAAYAGAAVVYFQFDPADFFSKHSCREGYFLFDRDGLGPVATTAAGAAEAVARLARRGFAPEEPYATRVRETFQYRDTNNCQRTVAAIERILA